MSKNSDSYEVIEARIFLVRGNRVMLDRDLAILYGVTTKALIQAVKRNAKRFPSDFMYLLTDKEVTILRSQIVTSSWGGRRYRPYAFTEQGVAMLSSVLNSDRAIHVNIQIMRTFVKLREMAMTYKELQQKLDELEKKYDTQFQVVFKAIKLLLNKPTDDPAYRTPSGGEALSSQCLPRGRCPVCKKRNRTKLREHFWGRSAVAGPRAPGL